MARNLKLASPPPDLALEEGPEADAAREAEVVTIATREKLRAAIATVTEYETTVTTLTEAQQHTFDAWLKASAAHDAAVEGIKAAEAADDEEIARIAAAAGDLSKLPNTVEDARAREQVAARAKAKITDVRNTLKARLSEAEEKLPMYRQFRDDLIREVASERHPELYADCVAVRDKLAKGLSMLRAAGGDTRSFTAQMFGRLYLVDADPTPGWVNPWWDAMKRLAVDADTPLPSVD